MNHLFWNIIWRTSFKCFWNFIQLVKKKKYINVWFRAPSVPEMKIFIYIPTWYGKQKIIFLAWIILNKFWKMKEKSFSRPFNPSWYGDIVKRIVLRSIVLILASIILKHFVIITFSVYKATPSVKRRRNEDCEWW